MQNMGRPVELARLEQARNLAKPSTAGNVTPGFGTNTSATGPKVAPGNVTPGFGTNTGATGPKGGVQASGQQAQLSQYATHQTQQGAVQSQAKNALKEALMRKAQQQRR
jgi:hypothetical protein